MVALGALVACTGTIEDTSSGPAGTSGSGNGTPGPAGTSGAGVVTPGAGSTGQGTSGAGSTPSGTSGGSGSGASGAPTTPMGPIDPGRVVMHRLNRLEYDNTVRDLFGTAIKLPEAFPPDDAAYGFDNVAETLTVTDTHIDYYFNAAKALATEALTAGRRDKIITCDLKAQQATCAKSSLEPFLLKSWRRPPSEDEVSQLVALYSANRTAGATEDEAFGRVLQGALMDPRFLWRIERNVTDGSAGPRDLDGYEVASRLSYFLWSSMPDDALLAAAGAKKLSTPADIQAQVTRMLASEKASALQTFGEQWLSVRNLDIAQPLATAFPSFDEPLRASMRRETMALFADLVSGKESLDNLLVPNFAYLDDRLAKHYGLPAPGSMTPVRTTLSAGSNRGGLLSQGGWLTVYAHANETAPVKRGNWILQRLLCVEVSPPPFMVPSEPERQPGQTRRDSLAAHRTDPTCASCHLLMDPLGLALEQYDGIGAYRTSEGGLTIQVDGTMPDGTAFSSPADLQQKIASSPAFPRCVARQMFIYALGRGDRPGTSDAAAIDGIAASFVSGGQKFPALLQAIATSDTFRKRQDAN